jgi:large subunit ribosomal protein L21
VFAVIQAGGRQVRVGPGEVVTVDHLNGEPGQEVHFERVLLVGRDGGDLVTGSPFVANARVVGTILDQVRGEKIRVFKKKRRKGYRRSRGHRSALTRVTVKGIEI